MIQVSLASLLDAIKHLQFQLEMNSSSSDEAVTVSIVQEDPTKGQMMGVLTISSAPKPSSYVSYSMTESATDISVDVFSFNENRRPVVLKKITGTLSR